MIIHNSIGKLDPGNIPRGKAIYYLSIAWYESSKRILHKRLLNGEEVSIRFLQADQRLEQDDILWEDESRMIVVDIYECETIVVKPASLYEMARLCYEVGNKHLPLFYSSDEVLLPFDQPIFKWLLASDFSPIVEQRKLCFQLRTTVQPHGSATSLFSKILKLTGSND